MEPDKLSKLKQQADRLHRTLELVNEVSTNEAYKPESRRLEEAAHPGTAAPASGKRIAEFNKAISEGRIDYAREIVEDLLKADPANSHLTTLLNQKNISLEDLQRVIAGFDHVRLQDEYNNARLAEAKERQEATNLQPSLPEEEPEAGDSQGPLQNQEEEQQQSQENQGQEQASGQQSAALPTRTPPIIRRPLNNRERFGTKENYAKYKSGLSDEEKDDRRKRAKDLWDRRKSGLLKPGASNAGGFNPLGDWLAKKVGEKIAQSKIGQAVARNLVDPLKQAITNSRAWQAIAPRLQPLVNAYNAIAAPFRAVNSALNSAGRAIGNATGYTPLTSAIESQLSSLQGAIGNGIRSGIGQAANGIGNQVGNLFNWARNNPIATMEFPAVGAGIAAIAFNPLTWWALALGSAFIITTWYTNLATNSECDRPNGQMQVTKSMVNVGGLAQEERHIENRGQIDYKIEVRYDRACARRKIESVEVTDKLPEQVEYILRSGRLIIFQPSQAGAATYDESTRTLTWNFKDISEGEPATLTYSVLVNEKGDNSWVMNQASVTYIVQNTSDGGFPATQDNCNGTYQLNNPAGNFGDPTCDFKKDDLYALLKQQDPRNADFWFLQVARCESGYNPNSYRDHNILPQTPDPAGAWGLYQMGRGRNGQYDHGDVDWRLQTSNAVTYAKSVPSIASYWACAR